MTFVPRTLLALSMAGALLGAAQAQTALPANQVKALQDKLSQRVPNLPPIESVRTTPVSGLYEIKVGNSVLYSDPNGDYLVEGHILETRTLRDLTADRVEEINRIDFGQLPFKDAVVWKAGNGKRKLVVFADPNCGYCKQLERELRKVKDVTVYTLMIPILGADSQTKVENIWCAKDRLVSWSDWMLKGAVPSQPFSKCSSPTQRNLALSQRLGVNGTPAIFFEDGTRLLAAAPLATIEQRLQKASAEAGR